jgi:uncharacterized protein with PhoU and TrkA domain
MKDTHTLAMEQFAKSSTWLERTGGYAHSMTLRDHFAAKAMQGLMDAAMPMPEIADAAYDMADAMLKERAK